MIGRLCVVVALALLGATAFAQSQQQALAVREVAPGVFVYTGQTAPMTRENASQGQPTDLARLYQISIGLRPGSCNRLLGLADQEYAKASRGG